MPSFPTLTSDARFLPVPDEFKAAFAPAKLCLFEWRDYFFQFPNAQSIRVAEKAITPVAPGLFRVRWENALGLCDITADNEEPFWVEVLSPKFPTPEAHFQFLSVVLNDLFTRSRHLVWHFGGETKRAFERSHKPPSPLETLDFLLRYGEKLEPLLARLLRNPPSAYYFEREDVAAHQVANLDNRAVTELARDLTRWQHTRSRSRFGHAFPNQISQNRRYEHFDSVEVRLARTLCSQIENGLISALKSRYFPALSPEKQARIRRLEKIIAAFTARFPESHTPVQNREIRSVIGHDLWNLNRELRGTGAPVFAPVQKFANVRDIASLWEFWSFFALVEAIEKALGQTATLEAEFDESRGLLVPSKALWGEWSLVFNGPAPSYSTPLRPDFLWFRGEVAIAAFDAKFRIDAENMKGRGADLHKMHAYCDALNIGAAIALHPGENTTFFDRERGPLAKIPFRAVLEGAAKGVGLWGARPFQTSDNSY